MNISDRLIPYQSTSHKRSQDHIKKCVGWVFRWGWSYHDVISRVIGVKRDYSYTLIKKGYLNVASSTLFKGKALVLSKDAASIAPFDYFDIFPGLKNETPVLEYNFVKGNVHWTHYHHNHFAQLVTLRIMKEYKKEFTYYLTERELRVFEYLPPQTGIPDAIIDISPKKDGENIWVEVELSSKYKYQAVAQLQRREWARQNGYLHQLIFFAEKAGVINNLKKFLKSPSLPKVASKPDGTLYDTGETWSPKELSVVTYFILGNVDAPMFHCESGHEVDFDLD